MLVPIKTSFDETSSFAFTAYCRSKGCQEPKIEGGGKPRIYSGRKGKEERASTYLIDDIDTSCPKPSVVLLPAVPSVEESHTLFVGSCPLLFDTCSLYLR